MALRRRKLLKMILSGLLSGLSLITGIADSGFGEDCEETVFAGPWVFTRPSGPPRTEEATFFVENQANNYSLHILNGDDNGSHRVSSGRIWINRDQIARPSDFGQQVLVIVRDVSLQGENLLKVKSSSSPGFFITVSIRGGDVCDEARGQFFIGFC